ncbi:hypothetical protein L7F22_042856 [Adiantum nelumboides]|nr:hypothetical protein [Adiantum nelumboides]
MVGGPVAGKEKGKAKGEMRGKYSSPKAKQGWALGPKTCLQLTRQAGVSKEKGPAPPMKSLTKLPVKGEKGLKEASATDATTQGGAPLIPEKRTKLIAEGRQAVPRPSVGDEAEAGAKNNQGAGKQKGTTLQAVRSPSRMFSLLPRIRRYAKGVEQQKEIAEPFKVPPPIERNKAEKKQGLGKGKEKSVSVGSQKPHEDILAYVTQGAKIQKEMAGTFEDPRMQKKGQQKAGTEKPTEIAMSSEVVGSQIIHENSASEKKQGPKKGKIPSLIEFSRMLLEEDCVAELPQQQAKKTKGKGLLVKPTEKVQVPKEVKNPKGKDISAPPNLSKAIEQPVKRKLPLQAATLGSPSKRAKVGSSGPVKLYIDGKLVWMCRADPAFPSQNTKMEKQTRMMDHLKKQHGLNVVIPTRVGGRVGGVSLNLVSKSSIRDQICTQERFQEVDRKYEVNRKAVERRVVIKALECWDCINKKHVRCSKDDFVKNFVASREEEDEGGDEEGGDDEEEGGEIAKEEGRESDEENEDGSDVEKTDEGEGSTGDDEDSKDEGKGSGVGR